MKANTIIRDSFWSIFGNGLGSFFLLIGGVLIARFLGKDIYGEYGLVKTTMFYIAGFASFGMSYSSTKLVAENISNNPDRVNGIIYSCIRISLSFSISFFLLILLFAKNVALFIHEPQLTETFRYLGILIIFKSLANTLNGLLGGFKRYKEIGINYTISGLILFVVGSTFTYLWGIKGSFCGLLISQY